MDVQVQAIRLTLPNLELARKKLIFSEIIDWFGFLRILLTSAIVFTFCQLYLSFILLRMVSKEKTPCMTSDCSAYGVENVDCRRALIGIVLFIHRRW